MMLICTVQMRNSIPKPPLYNTVKRQVIVDANRPGLVLIEMLLIVSVMALIFSFATFSFTGTFGRSQFEKQAYEFINTLKMAQNAAAQSDRRYAVILDTEEQTYTLRQYATLDFETIPEEDAIIKVGYFTEQCQVDYVVFDDYTMTNENDYEIRFRAGRSGWQNGGKIVLLDADGNPYSVILNRLSRVIMLYPGDIEIVMPEIDVPF